LGDSYNGSGKAGNKDSEYFNKHTEFGKPSQHKEKIGNPTRIKNLKPKDLIGIPWRIAFALQVDGWWLRQDIIWHKPNPMPESVVDRCTKSHEYIFLLSKSSKYYFDNEAIKEKGVLNSHIRNRASNFKKSAEMDGRYVGGGRKEIIECDGFRNKRSVFLADDEYMILKKDLTFATKQHIIEEMIKRELL
jgi:hypothetical protein